MKKSALIIIDVQNDYFPKGKYPLWNTEEVLENIIETVRKAQKNNIPVILVQHIADPEKGLAPFFNKGSEGVEIHPKLIELAEDAELVVKGYADSFYDTRLDGLLKERRIERIMICGMMTQNCVTHTAISPSAERYEVVILPDCCTTIDQMIHGIALNGVSTRVPLVPSSEAF